MCNETRAQQEKIALEEFAHLQNIIGRQDELKSKCKRLVVTLFSAFSFAFLSNKLPGIGSCDYVLLSLTIIISFLLIESVYGVTELNSENRVINIEKFLRGEIPDYNGPAICNSLHKEMNKTTIFSAIKRPRTYSLYLFLVFISFLIAIFNHDVRPGESASIDKLTKLVCSVIDA